MKAKYILPLLALLVPLVHASILPTNCALAPIDYQDCQNLLSDTSLSQAEKEDIYLNLSNPQTSLPAHDFAWQWNTKIIFNTQPPQGVPTQSSGIIQNAWVKIVAIHKSVYDANEKKFLVQPFGSILVAKNYSINLPSGHLPGECDTRYSYSITQNAFQEYANSQYIGNSPQTSYSFSLPNQSQLTFAAKWQLAVRLQTDHYRQNGRDCLFQNTTFNDYAVQLQDVIPATVVSNSVQVKTAVLDYNQFSALFLQFDSVEPLNQLTLSQENHAFSYSQARYDWNIVFQPYGVLQIVRIPEEKLKANFLIEDRNGNSFKFSTDSNKDCQLDIIDDFEETKKACNATQLKPDRLDLTLDGNSFDQNQTIRMTATLKDDQNAPLQGKVIQFSTKNEKQSVPTNAQGTASWAVPAIQSNGVFDAAFFQDFEYAPAQATERAPIAGSNLAPTAISVGVFFFSYYSIYFVAKKKFGVAL
ncbi:MAG: Ig-like domain-containing protein [Candidatus Diapherotrites archaeon]